MWMGLVVWHLIPLCGALGGGYPEDGGRVTEDIREFAMLLGSCCLVERQLRRKTNKLGSRALEAWELSLKAL